MERWDVAIAGLGAIGRAIAELMLARRERYRSVHGADVRLVAACGSRAGARDPDGLDVAAIASERLTPGLSGADFVVAARPRVLFDAGPTDFRAGGTSLGYARAALGRGTHLVAVSKGALAFDFPGLRALADRSGALLKFSGAAGAALPAVDLLAHGLAGCEVQSVEGILTATTNRILTAMADGRSTVAEVLERARTEGTAERDASFDVDGWDTACKILILADGALGAALRMDDVAVAGIGSVTPERMRDWRGAGLVPKLVGSLERSGRAIRAAVGVKLYAEADAFARVGGHAKAIRIVSDAMGETLAVGGGTEPLATAAAALKDFEHILAAGRRGSPEG